MLEFLEFELEGTEAYLDTQVELEIARGELMLEEWLESNWQ